MSYAERLRTMVFRADDLDSDDGDGPKKLRGIGVPFDDTTRIDNDWEGTFDEELARGAFKRSLSHRLPKVMFEHGRSPLGQFPIARLDEIEERAEGLWYEAEPFDVPALDLLRAGLEAGEIDSNSVRFRPITIEVTEQKKSKIDGRPNTQLQRITEAQLVELGPVVFPAYEGAELALRFKGDPVLHDAAVALLRSGGIDEKKLVGIIEALGTDSRAGSPADTDPDSLHSDEAHDRSRRLRLLEI